MSNTVPPHWVIKVKVKAKSAAHGERLVMALAQMISDDTGLGYSRESHYSGVTILTIDEATLERQLATLKNHYAIGMLICAPQVCYYETLAGATNADYTHKEQRGRTGQFARVRLRLAPNEIGRGNEFVSEIIGGVVPNQFIAGVEKGVQSVWASGVLYGFPMVDTRVTFYDGAYHEADSSPIAFTMAAREAMRKGCKLAGEKVLEPIMEVVVTVPPDLGHS